MTKKAYAKVNIFLKITGKRDNYHLLASRFARVKNLFDVIHFKPCESEEFILKGDFGCETQSNTIYKVYQLLLEEFPQVKEYFLNNCVEVEKNIPEFAGLGGGSSDAATFLLMVNEALNLGLSKDRMASLGVQVGADIPFFVYEYDSANVTGIGEIVEKYDESILDIETFTPNIQCDTRKIFKEFSANHYQFASSEEVNKLLEMNSIDIFNQFSIQYANDLYQSAINVDQNLLKVTHELKEKKYFFSGSGSSFFTIHEG